MKKFRFKYSNLTWTLLFVVLGLAIAGLVLNIVNLINYIPKGTGSIIIYSTMIFLITLLMVIDLSVILFGFYTIKDNELNSHFGIFKTTYDVNKITHVVLHKKDNKLVVYTSDEKFTVIMIHPSLYESFVLSIRNQNKSITYNVKENDGDPV